LTKTGPSTKQNGFIPNRLHPPDFSATADGLHWYEHHCQPVGVHIFSEVNLYRVNLFLLSLLGLGTIALIAQQTSTPSAAKPPAIPESQFGNAYPTRPPADPAAVQQGRQIFSANCSFCHGSDARGGEGGPNLIRSQTVLDDKNGELITTVVQNGRPDKGMPKFDLTAEQVGTIALFLHSIPVGGRAQSTGTVDPLVGDAKAGEAYFNGPGKCASCHSISKDLAGIGGKYTDIRALQSAFLSGERRGEPSEVARKTVTVTLPAGQVIAGKLYQVDDFMVSLIDANGDYHSYPRHGAVPRVIVTDPLQPHLDMLQILKDDDIHNLTAYLVTLK
jgi:cytochrome c oxidase cbb3-type subunit 3